MVWTLLWRDLAVGDGLTFAFPSSSSSLLFFPFKMKSLIWILTFYMWLWGFPIWNSLLMRDPNFLGKNIQTKNNIIYVYMYICIILIIYHLLLCSRHISFPIHALHIIQTYLFSFFSFFSLHFIIQQIKSNISSISFIFNTYIYTYIYWSSKRKENKYIFNI